MQPIELVISDDGSEQDVCSSITDIIKGFDFPVKYVRQEKNGFQLAKCRNNGVRNSIGKKLAFVDQDLVLSEKYLETFSNSATDGRFLTSYPIRLQREQSENLSENLISQKKYHQVLDSSQLNKIKKQYRKDKRSYFLTKIGLEKNKPKLRGGACLINKVDYEKVNGYDEKFIGWGNEDDDFRRRLYKAGVVGFNPHRNEYPMHLYHEPFHVDGNRVNKDYNESRIAEIEAGNYFCEFGLNNPFGENKFELIELN